MGQKYPPNTIDNINLFFHRIVSKRRYLNIGDDRLDLLINCDETALFFESPEKKKLLVLKGQKI